MWSPGSALLPRGVPTTPLHPSCNDYSSAVKKETSTNDKFLWMTVTSPSMLRMHRWNSSRDCCVYTHSKCISRHGHRAPFSDVN